MRAHPHAPRKSFFRLSVSYYEWLQNRSFEQWSEAEVHVRMSERMRRTFHAVMSAAEEAGLSYHTAAFRIALNNINA